MVRKALQNSFSMDMNSGCWYEGRRGHDLSPHATPALSDDDAAPVQEVSHRGKPPQWRG